LNKVFQDRSKDLLSSLGKPQVGSCQYNLTLINRCFPEATSSIKLKKEPLFEHDSIAVSWHADSSLEHYSSIAVYHYQRDETLSQSWRIALKVHPNAEGPQQGKTASSNADSIAPPVVVELPRECCYYILDDFNHHHQHAGTVPRRSLHSALRGSPLPC
jgi:hypothetical protein